MEGRQQLGGEEEEGAKSGEAERGEGQELRCNVLLLLLHTKWTLQSFLRLLLWHLVPFFLLPSSLPLSFLPILSSLPPPCSYPSLSSCPSLSQFLSPFPSPCLANVVDTARQTLQWMRKRQNRSHW